MLIYMFLSPGTVNPNEQLFPGQGALQMFLLLLAVICVPWMLCVKPYLAWREMKAHEGQGYGRVELRDDTHLQGEEEGDGAIIAEQAEDEDEVGSPKLNVYVLFIGVFHSIMISARSSSIKSFIPSSSV